MRFLIVSCLLFASQVFSQNFENTSALDVSIFRGNIMLHTSDISHLRTDHPTGFIVSFSRQTHGAKEWQRVFNYPDYGGYFMYQNYKNEFLGNNYAIGTHYNFYFLNRNLQFKVAQGLTYNTNPYNKVTNSKNKAFGSKLDANINLGLCYKKEKIIDNVGFQTGFLLTHSSNGRLKSPNSGINSYVFSIGLNYDFDKKNVVYNTQIDTISYSEPIHFNFSLKSGLNESTVIGSGQYPFYHFAAYADKRLNRKSAIQFGTELFLSQSLKEFIKYKSIATFEKHIDANTDYKRVGLMIGYELFINKISLEGQVGYYIYAPFPEEVPVYDRLGMKYYISKKLFAGASLKTHLFTAEAFEFGLGYRL